MRIFIGETSLDVTDRGTGRVLLLVHGFPLDRSMWVGQIDALSGSHRVIAPDLRGFGQSQVVSATSTMAQFADDLATMLDALGVTKPVVFCGLSMGGYIAFEFWRRHREKLRALALCDTRAAADAPEARLNRIKQAERVLVDGPASVAEAMLPKLFAPSTSETNPALIEATKQVILATAPETIAATQRGMAERFDMRDLLGEIDLPVLVVCGEHDAISPVDEMRAIAVAIPAARFEVIAGAGHMSPAEAPAAFNAVLQNWLDGLR